MICLVPGVLRAERANGAYLGQPLAIRLGATGDVTRDQLFFDDASLAQCVPEPATGALLALAGVAALRRRRRDANTSSTQLT